MTAKEYIFTATQSRAELKFPDESFVRVGQNTVFSFDSGSRTLSLEKGAMLFYVPPGSGGGNIKTPSLTAAITGTVGKATPNLIAVVSGQLQTPYGVVNPGYAIGMVDGEIKIFPYVPKEATAGVLWSWGPPPEIPEVYALFDPDYGVPDLRWLDVLEWTQLNPFVNFNNRIEPPVRKEEEEEEPEAPKPPPHTGTQPPDYS